MHSPRLLQDLSVLAEMSVQVPRAQKSLAGNAGVEAKRLKTRKPLSEVLEFWGQKGVVETISRAQWVQADGVYRK